MNLQGSPPTRLLYLEDAYVREFKAKILAFQDSGEQRRIRLDQTAFYPFGGGQPSDTGKIKGSNGEAKIDEVRMEDGQVVHFAREVYGKIDEGETVAGVIDWERRFALMCNHTLAHMMAEVIRRVTGVPAEVVSSGLDVDKARLDMAYDASLGPLLPQIEKAANEVIGENRPVEIRQMPRQEAESYVERFHESLKTLPSKVQSVRVVEVKGLHACACGGTHVRSTGEIGVAEVLRRSSKGKGVERVEFRAKTS